MKNIIKQFKGQLTLLLGIGVFFYNIFNFSHVRKSSSILPSSGGDWLYSYSPVVRLGIAVGAMLIVLGILLLRKKK